MSINIKFFVLILLSLTLLSISSCTNEEAERKKAISAEYAERMTKKFMEGFSEISGEKPVTQIISNKYNRRTSTVKVTFKSQWLGNPSYNPFADKELHEIVGLLTIYNDGEVDYDVISKNEVLQRNESNSAILGAINKTLEFVNFFSE